jgi:GrpB-like predicted nucleotidyltransferase (UPF0157 family)
VTDKLRSDDEIAAVRVGPPEVINGPITLVTYDPAWPTLFERERQRIRAVLGDRVRLLEHVGSTSVPGLSAKPIIDVVLAVADSSDEAAYVPALEAEGYELRVREPDWYQHRMLRRTDPRVNLHVFSAGGTEIERMLLFRDQLRADVSDRLLYERAKRELAQHAWRYVQHYADAKSAVVAEIMARAGATTNA